MKYYEPFGQILHFIGLAKVKTLKVTGDAASSQSMCGRFFTRILLSISACIDAVNSLKEPERHGCLARFVKSQLFGMLSTTVILCNAVFIFFATDYEMANISEATPSGIKITDFVLSSFYVVEVGLKLLVHRGFFFWNIEWAWNCFDS